MARLTSKERKNLSSKEFAGPDRSYPINDKSHARNALARASQFASPELRSKIARAIHAKFPSIKSCSHLKIKR